MTKKTRNLIIIIFAVFFLYFGWWSAQSLDSDYGWHLRMGQMILQQGIPASDPFSYTMPSYPVVRHEWITELFIAKATEIIGYNALAFIFGFFAVGAFFLQLVNISPKARRFAPMILCLVLLSVSGMVNIRTQIMTWVFFSFLLIIIRSESRFYRFGFLLPLLFLLWVNLHGGFAIGILTLFVACCYWWYKNPARKWFSLFIFGACFLATFLTPYGWRSWWEVWMTVGDSSLRGDIQEWIPTIFFPIISFWVLLGLSLVFVGKYWRRFALLDLILFGGLLIIGLTSVRHVPLLLLIAFPLTIEGLSYFYADAKKIYLGEWRFFQMGKVLFVGLCLLALPELQRVGYIAGIFSKPNAYPEVAVSYLRKNLPQGQIFSTYNWGGYLIWKLPEKKVFIDGRMPVWRRSEIVAGESNNAMKEYQTFVKGKASFRKVVDKYGITTLLLPKPYDINGDPFWRAILSFGHNILHLPLRKDKKEEGYSRLVKQAKQSGWIVVYEDETAQIYRKD